MKELVESLRIVRDPSDLQFICYGAGGKPVCCFIYCWYELSLYFKVGVQSELDYDPFEKIFHYAYVVYKHLSENLELLNLFNLKTASPGESGVKCVNPPISCRTQPYLSIGFFNASSRVIVRRSFRLIPSFCGFRLLSNCMFSSPLSSLPSLTAALFQNA